MAGKTFLQLQNAVMSDRFDETQRGDVKDWLNSAYWQLWSLEEWTFKIGTATVSVTQASKTVSGLPTDLGNVLSFQRGDGVMLASLEAVDFERLYYNARAVTSGLPAHYTVENGAIFVGPASSETASDYKLVYEREYTALVNDGDTAAIPAGGDEALVFRAASIGLKLQNDFTWQFFEQDYEQQTDALRRSYLRDRRDANPAYPVDPLAYY